MCGIIVFIFVGLLGGILAVTSTDVSHAFTNLESTLHVGSSSTSVVDSVTLSIWGAKYAEIAKNISNTYTNDPDNPFSTERNTTVNIISSTSFILKLLYQLVSPKTDISVKRLLFVAILPRKFIETFFAAGSIAFIIYIIIGLLLCCACYKRLFCCCCFVKRKAKVTPSENTVELEGLTQKHKK